MKGLETKRGDFERKTRRQTRRKIKKGFETERGLETKERTFNEREDFERKERINERI